jgi:putative restriction endonuclease
VVANGLCLNRLHDAAFDRKLITFDDELQLVVGRRIRKALAPGALANGFLAYEGQRLAEPVRRPVSMLLVRSHRKAFMAAEN